jgi:hypothetical protein
MVNIKQIDRVITETVKWMGDPIQYDLDLFSLGQGLDNFIVINPNVSIDVDKLLTKLPKTNRCIVWKCQDQWVAKKFNNKWNPNLGYIDIEISPSMLGVALEWFKNTDLDSMMQFEDDPFKNFAPELVDCYYELIWHIDHRFNPNSDEVWAVKCRPAGVEPLGVKDMGYLIPKIRIEFNPELPNLNLNVDELCPPYYELHHECAWMLDKRHAPFEDIWVAKIFPEYRTAEELVWLGSITPEFDIVYNDKLPILNYEVDYNIPWRDFKYAHMWMLDKKHTDGLYMMDKEMWAFKIVPSNKIEGIKMMGDISPTFTPEYNPDLWPVDYDIDYVVPYHDLGYEHIWILDPKHTDTLSEEVWAVRFSATDNPEGTKIMGYVSPNFKVEYNPDLLPLNYDIDYVVPYHDIGYEHVWMIDKKYNLSEDDIWAVKISATDEPEGVKVMGEVSPKLKFRYNKVLPKMDYEIDYEIPYQDLEFEHVWMLDSKHCLNSPEDIWAIKVSAVDNPKGLKTIGEVSPQMQIEYNPELSGYDFSGIEHGIQYHDFAFTNTWMLDQEYSQGFDIWAMKIDFVSKPKGYKELGHITPSAVLEYNKDLKNLKFDIDYKIPYHDKDYVHVWYLDSEYADGKKIWAARMYVSASAAGEKSMGIIVPEMPDYLDVIFISYNEINASENWNRVIEKAPWAKRIQGVKGIFEAHKAAARLATTDMFYVVDGDAYLTDDWEFNYQPGLFDRDCAYVWSAKNPVNDLTYGYGGVKLFSRKQFRKVKTWDTLDMTTGIMPKLKVMSKVSNITSFNTDEFSTWRSAFRECVKLTCNMINNPANPEHRIRLERWKKSNLDREFGQYASEAAIQAEAFARSAINEHDTLMKINDMDWLEAKFKEHYE